MANMYAARCRIDAQTRMPGFQYQLTLEPQTLHFPRTPASQCHVATFDKVRTLSGNLPEQIHKLCHVVWIATVSDQACNYDAHEVGYWHLNSNLKGRPPSVSGPLHCYGNQKGPHWRDPYRCNVFGMKFLLRQEHPKVFHSPRVSRRNTVFRWRNTGRPRARSYRELSGCVFTATVHATCRLSGHAAYLSRHRLH
jgi:hypothetical protein